MMTVEPAATFELRGESKYPEWASTAQATCPVCETRFEYLKVRDSAAQPGSRASDFQVVYRGVDPSRYVITVCPECSYASFPDDWDEMSLTETAALRAARGDRQGTPYLCADRSEEDLVTTIELALRCYADRAHGERRTAVLVHRRAWVERVRGDGDSERHWLTMARDAYQETWERDESSETEAIRLAYLVGDLNLRLNNVGQAEQWLASAVSAVEDIEGRAGADVPLALARMARDRLDDARKALGLLEAS